MIKVRMQIEGTDAVRHHIAALSGPALRAATAAALNDVGFDLRRRYQREITTVFDQPTPFISRSILVEQARPDHLQAIIGPTRAVGKGVDPASVLAAEIAGGHRRDKRSEIALRRAGILPAGYATVIPSQPFPGSEDGYGNIKGSFITMLLSYFRAFGEQGYRANMTDRRRRALAARGRTANGYKTINGFELFVAYGPLRGGKTRHLAPGIWAKRGIHGAILRPVLMFVRTPTYEIRLRMDRIGNPSAMQMLFERRLRYRIRLAAGV